MFTSQSTRALTVLALSLLRIDQPNDLLSDAFDVNDRFVVEDMMLSADDAILVDSSFLPSFPDCVW